MRRTIKLAAVAAAALAATAATGVATTASAAIVCNGAGACWHVRGPGYRYHPDWGLRVYGDNWRWGPHDHYYWREHAGRGYWRGNVWTPF